MNAVRERTDDNISRRVDPGDLQLPDGLFGGHCGGRPLHVCIGNTGKPDRRYRIQAPMTGAETVACRTRPLRYKLNPDESDLSATARARQSSVAGRSFALAILWTAQHPEDLGSHVAVMSIPAIP